ncbi:peptidase family M3 [Colletotrichum salicis]|uniref:Peptidase family M3 n=1 Tax=Colletotrichum salicis TaxID=1209931 RepID=A0A135ST80_9PEZI|nr:peptidase family M3 [Colletotrichum salicis]
MQDSTPESPAPMLRQPPQPLARVLAADEIIPTVQRVLAIQHAAREHAAAIITPLRGNLRQHHRPLPARRRRDAGRDGVLQRAPLLWPGQGYPRGRGGRNEALVCVYGGEVADEGGGRDDVPEERGKRFVTLERADYDAVLRYVRDPETRRRVYVAFDNRFPDNMPLFKEMLILRDENARMLGYGSHAEFRVERRVGPSTGWVEGFLRRLSKGLEPRGREEMVRVAERKRVDLGIRGDAVSGEKGSEERKILPWDFEYYTRLLEEEADVDQEMNFRIFPPDPHVNGHVGFVLRGYLKEDGSRVYPATVLMCAFQPPTAVSCALLKHREVMTLFHELGHGLHDLVSRTKHTRFHGTRVAPDFGEAPSTMLEKWCWMPDELVKMGWHYTRVDPAYMAKWKEDHADGEEPPPETLPKELADNLVESRELNRGLWFLRLLVFATFGMRVNNQQSPEALRELGEVKLYNDLQDSMTLKPNPDKTGYGLVHSTHLTELYDAGYYDYMRKLRASTNKPSSAIIFSESSADFLNQSAQAFTASFESFFAKDPRNPEAWDRYRRGILEYGGSRDEMEMMKEFLGREPGPDALLRSLGLLESDKSGVDNVVPTAASI